MLTSPVLALAAPAPQRQPQTLREGQGRYGLAAVRIAASERASGLSVRGQVGEAGFDLDLAGTPESRRITGTAASQPVDLESEVDGAATRLTGSIGREEVDLEVRSYGTQVNVAGHVGNRVVRVFVYRQIDGHVVDGFAGGQHIQLRDRDIAGRLGGLHPAEYLPAIIASGADRA